MSREEVQMRAETEALAPLLEQWDAMDPDEGFADRVMRSAKAREDEALVEPEVASGGGGWRVAAAMVVAFGLGGVGVFMSMSQEATGDDEEAVAADPESRCTPDDEDCALDSRPTELATLPASLQVDLERYVSAHGEHWGPAFAFSGVVMVARGDEVVTTSLGRLGVGDEGTPDANTVFRVGALTQPMVAVALLRYVHAGKLSLEQSIESCGVDVPAAWSKVTLQQLATHRSGIPNFSDSPMYQSRRAEVHEAQELWDYVGGEGLGFEPGSRYEPSNSNYALLGACLEQAGQSSLDLILRHEVFGPAGMRGARLGLGPEVESAKGMTFDEHEMLLPAPRMAPSALAGAGGVSVSANDLLAFHRALRDGSLLPAEAQTPLYALTHSGTGGLGYGMGWTSRLVDGDYEVGHPGGLDGFNAQFTRRLSDDTFVAVLLNHDSIDARVVGQAALELVDGMEVERPEEKMEVALDESRVALFEGRYRLSERSRKHYEGVLDPDSLRQMSQVSVEFKEGRLWMVVPEYGRKWMHPEGGERFFFKDLQATSAVFGLPSGQGQAPATFLSLRSGPLEFMLMREN